MILFFGLLLAAFPLGVIILFDMVTVYRKGWAYSVFNPPIFRLLDAAMKDLDSIPAQPAVTGKHVHVRPESPAPSRRTASDQAAGHGEHEGHHG